MRALSLSRAIFSNELRKVLAYRADFWVHFLGNMLSQIGVAYFLWAAIFRGHESETIGGYSFAGMMIYYVSVPFVDRMVRGGMESLLASEIFDGSLTRYLVYPISVFHYKILGVLANALPIFLQLVLVIGLYKVSFGFPVEIQITAQSSVMAFVALLVAIGMYFVLTASVQALAFWFDQMWGLMAMLMMFVNFLGGGIIPISTFPAWLQPILKILPFYATIALPIETFIGRVSFQDWLWQVCLAALWIGLIALFLRVLWRKGLRQYSGVGQ